MGESNFTYTFSSIHDEWIVRQVCTYATNVIKQTKALMPKELLTKYHNAIIYFLLTATKVAVGYLYLAMVAVGSYRRP